MTVLENMLTPSSEWKKEPSENPVIKLAELATCLAVVFAFIFFDPEDIGNMFFRNIG
jgi:hypothetical protein